MVESHAHLGITHDAFENLKAALRENGVSEENRAAILSKVEELRESVVTATASD